MKSRSYEANDFLREYQALDLVRDRDLEFEVGRDLAENRDWLKRDRSYRKYELQRGIRPCQRDN